MFRKVNGKVFHSGICGVFRQIHSRHYPNDVVTVKHPQAKDFEEVKIFSVANDH